MKNYVKIASISVVIGTAVAGSVVLAQDSTDSIVLEQVIVTAQKRAENLQEVPIAVTALSADAINKLGITTTQDLQFAVPGLVYNQSGGRAQAFLRGVGNNISAEGVDPSVATYIDGVYVPSTAGTILGLLGVERVEVLKGPQGTLYGRNATGGAINITTRSPTDEMKGNVTVGYGNYNRREIAAFFASPIGEHFAASIDVGGSKRDSYMDIAPLPATPVGLRLPQDDEDEWSARVKLVYDSQSWLKLTATGDYTDYQSLEDMAVRQIQSNATGYANGAVPNLDRRSASVSTPINAYFFSKSASLRADIDLGATRLVAMSAYRDLVFSQHTEEDGTSWGGTSVRLHSSSEMMSHELQWLSDDASPIQWIVGAFAYSNDSAADPNGAYNGNMQRFLETNGFIDATSYSGFGQATIPFGDGWRATLGLRYTDDHQDYTAYTQAYVPATQALGVRTNFTSKSASWSEWTPKAVIDYTLGDVMYYGSVSRGFKSGLYNIGTPAAPGPVDPEILDAYEIGVKSELFDRRLRLNTSVYYYDYQNLQVQNRILNPVTGLSNIILQNAATAEIKGVDLEAVLVATGSFTINSSLSYVDSEYKEFRAFNANVPAAVGNTQVALDVSGNEIARAPEWSGTLGVRYDLALAASDLSLSANWYYNGGYSFVSDGLLRQEPYNLLNASIEYTPPTGSWHATLWGKNLGNAYYYGFLLQNTSGTLATVASPRTYGVSVSYDFGGK